MPSMALHLIGDLSGAVGDRRGARHPQPAGRYETGQVEQHRPLSGATPAQVRTERRRDERHHSDHDCAGPALLVGHGSSGTGPTRGRLAVVASACRTPLRTAGTHGSASGGDGSVPQSPSMSRSRPMSTSHQVERPHSRDPLKPPGHQSRNVQRFRQIASVAVRYGLSDQLWKPRSRTACSRSGCRPGRARRAVRSRSLDDRRAGA